MYDTLITESKDLPEDMLFEIVQFVRFLKSKMAQKHSATNKESRQNLSKRKPGILSGGLLYMADDFDETPDCFQEYM